VSDPGSIHPAIVLIEINDTTLRDLVPFAGRWPWPRALHTLLLSFLRDAKAKVVALDLGFSEPEREASYPLMGESYTSARSDQELADAVRASGNVILLADAVSPGSTGETATPPSTWSAPAYHLGPAIEERPQILPPYQALADAAAGLGHNFLALDQDGPARRLPPFVRHGDKYMASLGIAAVLAADGIKPGSRAGGSHDTHPRSTHSACSGAGSRSCKPDEAPSSATDDDDQLSRASAGKRNGLSITSCVTF
jgi:adenylate cyclase